MFYYWYTVWFHHVTQNRFKFVKFDSISSIMFLKGWLLVATRLTLVRRSSSARKIGMLVVTFEQWSVWFKQVTSKCHNFFNIKLKLYLDIFPLNTGRKLNVHKFERFMYAQFTSCIYGVGVYHSPPITSKRVILWWWKRH